MGRLKKGEQKKVQMTIRIEPDVAEKLKSIDKYSSKMTSFIKAGINDYEKWLFDNSIDKKTNKSDDNSNNEILNIFYDEFNNKKRREYYINYYEKRRLKLKEEEDLFGKYHPEIMDRKYKFNNRILDLLKNWNELKNVFFKDISNIKKKGK